MAEPKRGDAPMVLDQAAGKKACRSCSLSANRPYRDGSHSGSGDPKAYR